MLPDLGPRPARTGSRGACAVHARPVLAGLCTRPAGPRRSAGTRGPPSTHALAASLSHPVRDWWSPGVRRCGRPARRAGPGTRHRHRPRVAGPPPGRNRRPPLRRPADRGLPPPGGRRRAPSVRVARAAVVPRAQRGGHRRRRRVGRRRPCGRRGGFQWLGGRSWRDRHRSPGRRAHQPRAAQRAAPARDTCPSRRRGRSDRRGRGALRTRRLPALGRAPWPDLPGPAGTPPRRRAGGPACHRRRTR